MASLSAIWAGPSFAKRCRVSDLHASQHSIQHETTMMQHTWGLTTPSMYSLPMRHCMRPLLRLEARASPRSRANCRSVSLGCLQRTSQATLGCGSIGTCLQKMLANMPVGWSWEVMIEELRAAVRFMQRPSCGRSLSAEQ